ncbi:hypothetical protein [Zhihengliuella flava]|uniref:Uncharacterized protein n=1 Tax=Zhihengliuella flava TaxID=1285193 RepID=A0A931D8Z6_9MICC|nr:hypothetical protein [Zhihengliuella flava]MBG6085840.1 hypothetical protein [Zhihengliuella flava]
MEITKTDATLLAQLINRIRPDWDTRALTTLIGKNRTNIPNLAALTIAATTKAQDPTCKTPAPIFIPGPHWPTETHRHLPPPPPCQDHPEEPAHNCRCCWSEIKTGQRAQTDLGKTPAVGATTTQPPEAPQEAAK